jgi:hypothetical protein
MAIQVSLLFQGDKSQNFLRNARIVQIVRSIMQYYGYIFCKCIGPIVTQSLWLLGCIQDDTRIRVLFVISGFSLCVHVKPAVGHVALC